uniref:Proline-rich protein n=1 Tax=Daucus carota subsp. sativus TaxID=79200 RepID=A0A166FWV8_DAUCS
MASKVMVVAILLVCLACLGEARPIYEKSDVSNGKSAEKDFTFPGEPPFEFPFPFPPLPEIFPFPPLPSFPFPLPPFPSIPIPPVIPFPPIVPDGPASPPPLPAV